MEEESDESVEEEQPDPTFWEAVPGFEMVWLHMTLFPIWWC